MRGVVPADVAACPYDHRVVMTWREAEELAAAHMRWLGFDDAAVTGPGTDGGLDVIASGAVAQVKHHASPVGAPDVQRLRGAAFNTYNALFYSSSGYTPAAIAAAQRTDVALFRINLDRTVTAMNDRAVELRPPPPPSARELERREVWAVLQPQRLRQRAWLDATLPRLAGVTPLLSRGDLYKWQVNPSAVVEAVRAQARTCGSALINVSADLRTDARAESQADLFAEYPEARERYPQLNDQFQDLPALLRRVHAQAAELNRLEAWAVAQVRFPKVLASLVRAVARDEITQDPDEWVGIPVDVVLPGV